MKALIIGFILIGLGYYFNEMPVSNSKSRTLGELKSAPSFFLAWPMMLVGGLFVLAGLASILL